jgi:arabinogalactan endo-1,4-beta-galactosidase
MQYKQIIGYFLCTQFMIACTKPPAQSPQGKTKYDWQAFVMGADMSYVNEVEDAGGQYRDSALVKDPFAIYAGIGGNCVRVRLWHTPSWKAPLNSAGKIYSNLADVEKTIRRAKANGMVVNLNLHYSDDWADPGNQPTPAAWRNLPFNLLKDSVYQYTKNVLDYLAAKNLTPEMIQIGNENNNGMLWPLGKIVGDSNWLNFGALLNSGIRAVRDFSINSSIKPKIILHEAQLQTAEFWTNRIINRGMVTDFDILGYSHYYKWSTVHTMQEVQTIIAGLKTKYQKPIMIVETAFPWTNDNADTYNNLFWSSNGGEDGFAFSKDEQNRYLKELTQAIMDGGGTGIMVWEPFWITSSMSDRWGRGSSWENTCFFDFSGNLLPSINFMWKK